MTSSREILAVLSIIGCGFFGSAVEGLPGMLFGTNMNAICWVLGYTLCDWIESSENSV